MPKGSERPTGAGALGLLLAAVVVAALGWQASTRSVDFPVYHRVARELLAGDYGIYPPEVYSGAPLPPHGFRYLPAIAFLFVPFAWLPLPVASFLFFAIKLASLAWMGQVLSREAGLRPGWRQPLIALLIVGGYVAEELRYGNAHLLVVALMVVAWRGAERGARWTPGLALALAIASKITPLALLGYFALRRRFAVCAVTVGMLALLVVAPAAVVGIDANNRLLGGFARYALEKTEESDNYSLRGAIHRLLTGGGEAVTGASPVVAALPEGRSLVSVDGETVAWLAASAAIGAVTLALLWRAPGSGTVALLDFSLVLVTMLIVSPHTQRRYFMQLYVPVLVLLGVLERAAPRERAWARIGLAATAAAGTVLPLVFGGRTLSRLYESAAPYQWAAILLWLALVRAAGQGKTDNR